MSQFSFFCSSIWVFFLPDIYKYMKFYIIITLPGLYLLFRKEFEVSTSIFRNLCSLLMNNNQSFFSNIISMCSKFRKLPSLQK